MGGADSREAAVGGRTRKVGTKRRAARKVARTPHIVTRIQGTLSLDLLHPNYRGGEAYALYYACLGHCYAATEALYYLYGRDKGFVPYIYKHENGDTHWWLANPDTGEVLDPTEPQLAAGPLTIHEVAVRSSSQTKPSRRAAEIMRRLKVS